MLRQTLPVLFASLLSAAAGLPAAAQNNPLDRNAGGAAAPSGAAPGNPAGGAAPGQPAVRVPDWVQPGAQVIFASGSMSRWAGSGERRPGGGTGGQGYTVHDVLMVAPRGVLVRSAALGIIDPASNNLMPAGATTKWITQMEIATGVSFFIAPESLAAMQTGGGFTVGRDRVPMHGQSYDAVMISKDQPNAGRGGNTDTYEAAFEVNTGIKLLETRTFTSGTGPNQTAGNSTERFEAFRQLEGAWINQDWPQWTADVSEVTFTGTQTYEAPGVPPVAIPTELVYRVQERGDGWVTGTIERSSTNPLTGQRETEPGGTPFACTTHMLGGLWMGPQTLANMPEGVIDQDPTTGTTIRYTRDARAQTGTVTHTYTDGSTVASTYDLGSGLTTAVRIYLPAMNQTIELALSSYR